MSIIYYSPKNTQTSERLLSVIEALVAQGQIETYQSIPRLSRRLREPAVFKDIAVLVTVTKNDLLEILSIKDLLDGIRVILVLPDRASYTVSRAYTIFPRFLSYADSDFNDVSSVLKKMLMIAEQAENLHKEYSVPNKNDQTMISSNKTGDNGKSY